MRAQLLMGDFTVPLLITLGALFAIGGALNCDDIELL